MSTQMIDFNAIGTVIGITREKYPLGTINTVIMLAGDNDDLHIACSEEEHEKIVADYLTWKDMKEKIQCSPMPEQTTPIPKPFRGFEWLVNPSVKIEEIEESTDTVYDSEFVLDLAGRLIEKAKIEQGSCKSLVIKTPALAVTLVFSDK